MKASPIRTVACLVVLGCGTSLGAQAPGTPSAPGGTYTDLAPFQRRLFDDVLHRYNAIAGKRYSPATAYDALPPSRRTTFEAVTNALATTTLTDSGGGSLGTALDIIHAVDEILGETRGTRGDRQFRLYAVLTPDAVDRLTKSQEFARSADNTIYHPGYPLSFRLRGGTPSIQVSVSRDGRRGDIDVDYRASRFPAALFNGHLTSANSDVRAGANFDRHQRRWSGLGNWWQQLLEWFSTPVPVGATESTAGIIPVQPRLPAAARIETVVEDFLSGWLIERRPELSVSYFSPLSFACIAPRGGQPVGEGLERYVILQRMKAANNAIGTATELSQAAVSVNPWDARLRVQRHRRAAAFLLARVPPDLAAGYDCANRAESDPSPTLTFADYYISAFRLRVAGGPAPVLVLLWAREPGGFRIVAVDVEEAAEPRVPIRGTPRPVVSSPNLARRVAGPPALIAAATAFHRAWFLERDFGRAVGYFDEASYGCLDAVSAGAMGADRRSMQTMLEQVSAKVRSRATLPAAIRTTEPAQAGVDVVDHHEHEAFALVKISDAFADSVACGAELPARADADLTGDSSPSGQAFVSYFQLNLSGDPAFIWMLWRAGAAGWTIHYWTLVTP